MIVRDRVKTIFPDFLGMPPEHLEGTRSFKALFYGAFVISMKEFS